MVARADTRATPIDILVGLRAARADEEPDFTFSVGRFREDSYDYEDRSRRPRPVTTIPVRSSTSAGWIVAGILFAIVATIAILTLLPNAHLNLKVPTVTICQPPAPYAKFDGIHESGDSKWRVPVDTCSD